MCLLYQTRAKDLGVVWGLDWAGSPEAASSQEGTAVLPTVQSAESSSVTSLWSSIHAMGNKEAPTNQLVDIPTGFHCLNNLLGYAYSSRFLLFPGNHWYFFSFFIIFELPRMSWSMQRFRLASSLRNMHLRFFMSFLG